MWRNGINPSGAIEVEGKIGPEAFAQLQERWRQLYAGPRQCWPRRCLGSRRQMATDRRLSRRRRTTEVAPVHSPRTMPRLRCAADAGRHLGSRKSFTNSEQASRWYATHTLRPWIVKIQAEARRSPVQQRAAAKHELGIDMSDLLRGSPLERWQANEIASRSGVLTQRDPRRRKASRHWRRRHTGAGGSMSLPHLRAARARGELGRSQGPASSRPWRR